MNPVFNIEDYKNQIEDFDPAAYQRQKARERAIERACLERQSQRQRARETYQRKIGYQRKLGILSIFVGIACICAGVYIPELGVVTVPFLFGGICLITTKRVVIK